MKTRRQKYLSLMLKSPERLAVEYPVPVSLVDRSEVALLLRSVTSCGLITERRISAEHFVLPFFLLFPYRHRISPIT